MDKDGAPQVFGDGDLTIAISRNGQIKIYSGQTLIGLVQELKIEARTDQSTPSVEIRFPKTLNVDLDAQVESHAREISKIPWIKIIRQ